MGQMEIFQRRNSVIVFLILFFIIFWVFSGWNIENADLFNYEVKYDNYKSMMEGGLDLGFFFIFGLLNQLGVSFYYARIILYAFFYLVLVLYCYKYSLNPIFVLVIYFAFHFVRDVVELRNAFACLFLLLALPRLGSYHKVDSLFSKGLLLLSVLMHFSYLPFLILAFVKKDYMVRNAWLYVLVFFAFSFFIKDAVSFIDIDNTALNNKISGKLETHLGNVSAFLVVSFSLFIIHMFCQKAIAGYDVGGGSALETFSSYAVLTYNINVFSSILISFSAYNFAFVGRLYGSIVLFNYIFLSNYFAQRETTIVDRLLLLVYIVFTIVCFSMSKYHYVMVFSNNALF